MYMRGIDIGRVRYKKNGKGLFRPTKKAKQLYEDLYCGVDESKQETRPTEDTVLSSIDYVFGRRVRTSPPTKMASHE